MGDTRWDETWHRLRDWTGGSARAERLAVQLLGSERYRDIDPSHALGGKDGGRDALCTKDDGGRYVMAVYFPRRQQKFKDILKKLRHDMRSLDEHGATGLVFVTNQEILLAERARMRNAVSPRQLDLFHLERITGILDRPDMHPVRKQFLDIGEDQPTYLGGEGGKAPGAGGGGGGALGVGARGGDGGAGGDMVLDGRSSEAPGAGGGGGGATGDGAKAGEGGGGGQMVRVAILGEELQSFKAAGWVRCEIAVGAGGRGGEHGNSGSAGEDTVVHFVTDDGSILKSIVAKGGRGGDPGMQSPAVCQVGSADLESEFKLTAVQLANAAQMCNGLLYLLGAGWEVCYVPAIPFETTWPVICSVELGRLAIPQGLVEFLVQVRDPTGALVAQQSFFVGRSGAGAVSRPNYVVPVALSISGLGIWTVHVVSGGIVFQTLPVEVSLRK